MPEKMNFEDMISALDGACGRLIVASMSNPEIREAMEMVTNVSLSLGEWAAEICEHEWEFIGASYTDFDTIHHYECSKCRARKSTSLSI